jgi:HPr kinase/phosphorylase
LKQELNINSSTAVERIHGVLVSVKNVGVLIIGKSGIGKSECALELITRHHKLVADDLVVVSIKKGKLIGESDPLIKGYMELHGLGVIKVRSHFGRHALINKKYIDMVIEFVEWQDPAYQRGFLKPSTYVILGKPLPLIKLPVRPARNMALLVEVAVTSFLLKSRGIDEGKELEKKIAKRIKNANKQ